MISLLSFDLFLVHTDSSEIYSSSINIYQIPLNGTFLIHICKFWILRNLFRLRHLYIKHLNSTCCNLPTCLDLLGFHQRRF